MTRNEFTDHLFDLLNESDYLDVHNIESMEGGYRVITGDGAIFNVTVAEADPMDNIIQLYPDREV